MRGVCAEHNANQASLADATPDRSRKSPGADAVSSRNDHLYSNNSEDHPAARTPSYWLRLASLDHARAGFAPSIRLDSGTPPHQRSPLTERAAAVFRLLLAKLPQAIAVLALVVVASDASLAADHTNIVIVLADDLGYGDVGPLNSDSKIPTPALDQLASEGITFTDAHTPSAVCTPTRYGLVTGRYCWRTRLKRGVLNGYGTPLIDDGQPTLGEVFGKAGYRTAVVGKWHLGLGLKLSGKGKRVDLSVPLTHHPGTVGFDESYVIPASLDFPPYAYFENGLATSSESVSQPKSPFPKFLREGPRASDFDMRGCLDHLTDVAVAKIAAMKNATKPSLLYFPLTAPHKPVLPSEAFSGKSGYGPYGDFIQQVDAVIGRVTEAIDSNGLSENTLLIVTSDNGSFMHRLDEGEQDHVDDESLQGFRADNHTANLHWRGTKADVWEAGHRVPFFVRLPGKQHAGSRNDSVIGLVDVMATLVEYAQADVTEVRAKKAGPDSVSFASLLKDPESSFDRSPLICHSASGMFAIRDGKWKLVAGNGSGGRQQPKGKPFAEPWMLFDLDSDPTESTNVSVENPSVFAKLKQQLLAIKGDD